MVSLDLEDLQTCMHAYMVDKFCHLVPSYWRMECSFKIFKTATDVSAWVNLRSFTSAA